MEQALSRRERKKLETRQGLLEAAYLLFREKGYDETTVEEITERADVAKGTFFNYFPSKQALLGELMPWRFTKVHDSLDLSRGAPASPMARIKLLMRLVHEQMLDDWQLFQQAWAMRLGRSHPPGHQAKRRMTGLLSELVREAQSCGEIRADVEPELVSDLMFVAHIRSLAACFHANEAPPPVGDSERVVDLVMDGLAGPNWRRI
jgi:AcrR family transcriptional regulator